MVSPCFALALTGFCATAVPAIPASMTPVTGSNKAKEYAASVVVEDCRKGWLKCNIS